MPHFWNCTHFVSLLSSCPFAFYLYLRPHAWCRHDSLWRPSLPQILGMLFMMPTKLLHKRCHEYGYGASWFPVGRIVRDLQASVSQPCQLLLPEVLLYILASGYFSAVNVIVLVYQRAEYIGRYGVRLWYKQTGFTSHLRNTVFTFYFCFVKICWIKAVSRTRGPCA